MALRLLRFLFSPLKTMTALLDRLVGVFSRFQSREADLRRQLADALADDAADEAAIVPGVNYVGGRVDSCKLLPI